MKVGIQSATTLDANYTINDTTVTVASTSGWPSDTGITFAMDVIDSAGLQVAGTYNEFVGTVSTATSITNVDYADGTGDRNYTAGATTRVYIPVSKTRENRLVEGMIAEHNQDGTHSAITATSLATDTIMEDTAAAGVTIDGLLIKDSKLAENDSVVTANITDGSVTPAKLAAHVYMGNISAATFSSTGNKAVTGVGFTPKYVEFTVLPSASGSASTTAVGGMTTAAQFSVWASANASGNTSSRNTSTSACVGWGTSAASTYSMSASYVSMDADGFTINVGTADGTFAVQYVAYG